MPQKPAGGGPRLIDAMPRPLLVVFLALALIAIGGTILVLLKPASFEPQPVSQRRPPPTESFSHDVGEVHPAPLPSSVRTIPPQCPAVEGAKPLGGPSAVERGRLILREICRLSAGGVGPDIEQAIEGVRGATIRTAQFELTGVDSTVDIASRTIYLNTKFVLAKIPVAAVVPVVLHEAWHLAHAGEQITAGAELGARRAELAACRELVPADDWPKWCEEARTLVSMPEARAIDLLVRAGYSE